MSDAATLHHARKYHDPDSEFYIGGGCVNCEFGRWQKRIEANNQELFDRLYDIGCERIDGIWFNRYLPTK